MGARPHWTLAEDDKLDYSKRSRRGGLCQKAAIKHNNTNKGAKCEQGSEGNGSKSHGHKRTNGIGTRGEPKLVYCEGHRCLFIVSPNRYKIGRSAEA